MTILSQYRIYPTAGGTENVWSTTPPIVSSTGGTITSSSTGILESIEISNLVTTVTSAQSPYTALLLAGTITCDTTGGPIIINLPDTALVLNSVYYFKNIGTNSVTLIPFGAQTIDDNTSYVLSSSGNDMIALQSSDTEVWVQTIDTSTADLDLSVNSTATVTNKTITDFTNTVVGFLRPGNTIVVDSIYGNNTTASRGGVPFATLSAALTLAQNGDTVWLLPGIQTLTAPVILVPGVSITGLNTKSCVINYAATTSTTMFTMAANTRIDSVTINLTSATAGITLTGIQFPALTTDSAKIRSSIINVISTTTGAVTLTGVYANGYGIPSNDETPAIRATTINAIALTSTSGACRGIYMLYATNAILTIQMYIRDSNILAQTNNASMVTTGALIDASTVSTAAILNVRSVGCKAIGTGLNNNDYLETTYGKIIASGMETTLTTVFNTNISGMHLIGNSVPMIIAASGSAAGTIVRGNGGGTTSTISVSPTSRDLAGTITVNVSGTVTANVAVFTFYFRVPYATPPFIIIQATSANSKNLATTRKPFVSTITTSSFIFIAGTTTMGVGPYVWTYHIIQ